MQTKVLLALLGLGGVTSLVPVQAAEFCADEYYITATLPNQARWDMCWEHRNREGIVLHNIHYTPKNGTRRKVLYQAALAQIHVPYDDNGARYHDVSDYGLGGGYMVNLNAAECPNGQLLNFSGKNVLCQQVLARDDAYSVDNDRLQGDALNLFSVSAIGAYNYIPTWRFLDDGSIEPSIGATGALQRFGTAAAAPHGWLLEANKVGIAHLHNFFWKLDFDLGGTSNDDAVEEINHTQTHGKLTRTVTRFTTEAARTVDPTQVRSWRVLDTNLKNSKNLPISYEIQLPESGQRDVGPSSEPFTHADFYVTRQKPCELFASHNPITNGCAENLAAFANGESLTGQDIVVWPSTTFYHMPRAEDAPRMDAHWSSIRIIPRDWHDKNPLSNSAETAPTVTQPPPPPPPSTPTGAVSNNGNALVLDGNLSDWATLRSFGLDPADMSGTNNTLDWVEGWLANDAERVYVAYRTKNPVDTSKFWAYQVYLDTDNSYMTGYRSGAIGAEFLLEGNNLWRYSGTGTTWQWVYQGRLSGQASGNVAELSFPRSWLGTSSSDLRLFFWGNNLAFGGTTRDTYPDGVMDSNATLRYFSYKLYTAPPTGATPLPSNSVTNVTVDGQLNDWANLPVFAPDPADMASSDPLDWLTAGMAHNSSTLYLHYTTKNPINTDKWWAYQVYLDTDNNGTTGYQKGAVGAEYMLEGKEVWRYSGDGSSWEWTHQGSATAVTNHTIAEFSFPRQWLGNPAQLRLLLRGNNATFGGESEDVYPNVTATPRYLEYRFQ